MRNNAFDVCINGAGPVGATMAHVLANQGLKVLLLERRALPRDFLPALDGRAYALNAGVRPLLERTGIWNRLTLEPQPIKTIHVVDGADKTLDFSSKHSAPPVSFTFEAPDIPAQDEAFGWMVEAADLLPALTRSLEDSENIQVFSEVEGYFAFHKDHVEISVPSRGSFYAPLVIAADGRGSALREKAGIPLVRLPYNKDALVTLIAHEHPHHGSALENFLPQGPFARLPMRGTAEYPHRSAIVWTDRPAIIRRLREMDTRPFLNLVSEKVENRSLGELENIGERWTYPLASQYALKYIAPRLMLIGDAAHGLHPVAGQGMNLGFRDVHILEKILGEAFSKKEDLGSPVVLRRYQAETRPVNLALLAGCDLLERAFSSSNPFVRKIRGLGIQAFHRFPLLRKKVARLTASV